MFTAKSAKCEWYVVSLLDEYWQTESKYQGPISNWLRDTTDEGADRATELIYRGNCLLNESDRYETFGLETFQECNEVCLKQPTKTSCLWRTVDNNNNFYYGHFKSGKRHEVDDKACKNPEDGALVNLDFMECANKKYTWLGAQYIEAPPSVANTTAYRQLYFGNWIGNVRSGKGVVIYLYEGMTSLPVLFTWTVEYRNGLTQPLGTGMLDFLGDWTKIDAIIAIAGKWTKENGYYEIKDNGTSYDNRNDKKEKWEVKMDKNRSVKSELQLEYIKDLKVEK